VSRWHPGAKLAAVQDVVIDFIHMFREPTESSAGNDNDHSAHTKIADTQNWPAMR
jgi:hypothetical protein